MSVHDRNCFFAKIKLLSGKWKDVYLINKSKVNNGISLYVSAAPSFVETNFPSHRVTSADDGKSKDLALSSLVPRWECRWKSGERIGGRELYSEFTYQKWRAVKTFSPDFQHFLHLLKFVTDTFCFAASTVSFCTFTNLSLHLSHKWLRHEDLLYTVLFNKFCVSMRVVYKI